MRTLPLWWSLAACGPKIDPGPSAADRAREPVRLLSMPVEGAPDVYLAAMIRAGSAWDPVGAEGTAALTLRSMVEAGAADRSSEQLRDELYPTGNAFEQVVDREWVSLRLRCHRDHAEVCAALFADVLIHPRFDPNDVIRLREDAEHAVTDGLLSDEEALGLEVLESVLYEGHPYGHPPAGRAGVIGLVGAEGLRAFHQTHYVREAMVVGVAGGFAPELEQALAARLLEVPAAVAPELPLVHPPSSEGRSLLALDTNTPVTGLHLGHPLDLDRDDPDWAAMTLATTALGAHRQSFGRLFRSLRAEHGLNYGDYAYVEPYQERGSSSMAEQGVIRRDNRFAVWIRPTSLENGPFALKLALDELGRWVDEGLEPQELDDVRSWMKGTLLVGATDPGRRLAYALEAAATGTPDLLETLPARLDALTLEEVNAAIPRHVHPEDLRIVAVSGEAEEFVRRVLGAEPTPPVLDAPADEAQAARDAEVSAAAVGVPADRAWTAPADGWFR